MPSTEKRRLEDVRLSLRDRDSTGSDILYAIAMDVCKQEHLGDLKARNLLYGICIYAAGQVGLEPVRSQGHIHAVSPSCNSTTPELYEILEGKAYILMQKGADESTNRAYAVYGEAGDKILVPPGFAHCTINADPDSPMVFGAWCVRDYGFDYQDVRRMGGLSYFPVILPDRTVQFEANPKYNGTERIVKRQRIYTEFKIAADMPIYEQYEHDHTLFDFVTSPAHHNDLWDTFKP
ncbi:MAG: glucose-6-phosphate isomerase family protein [Lachnospiraceae bacterium]